MAGRTRDDRLAAAAMRDEPGGMHVRKIRVLHIIQCLDYGGMERLLADLIRKIDRTRFEVHLMAVSHLGRFSQGLDEYANLHTSAPLSRYSMIWPRSLARQIREIAPDIVHTHSGVWYKGSLAARQAGVPYLIHTDHGRASPDPWQARLLDGLASNRTDRIVAVSDALASQLVATVVNRPERIRVIRNGVDTDAFRPRPESGTIRRELGIAPEVPVIGSIGRLQRIKGYDIMLAAFAELRATWRHGTPPVLVIGGNGLERAGLEAYIRGHALEGAVHLLGWRDDVHELLGAFTIFTLSSRSEGTSISLLEAMSCGLCPVVTDVGGNAAVLGESLRHRLVAPEDPAALARAWRAALTDPDRMRADARAARDRVVSKFSIEATVRAYEELYHAGSKVLHAA